ncbi:hypothetical protein F3J23_14405 [Chryseobacterium sp. Tr-659]|uniref:hypothetical protein n=1 Tax=Chryseobacterium sp. Tr-659 TaxID=2608340 RepID=UPI0014227CC1|nr:hypothetical protein [Chryseobacterium sp. Tr-659]NIF06638.1 hypothetical protein [Chryseobacterium sp. Tr-659]
MEKNELKSREELKTYFETGKHPTQSQFSNFIDSLRHKEDALSNKEVAMLANSLASIDNVFVYYAVSNVGTLKFPIVISSQDEKDQEIIVKNTNGNIEKRFLLGSAPYTIKAKKISVEELSGTEYYALSYQLSQSYAIYRMFGNNLDLIPEGFDFGKLKENKLPIQIGKLDFGQKVKVVNTNVKFVNNTEIPIQYRVQSGLWSNEFTVENTVTHHYDMWDYLYFYYNADLRGINYEVQCDIYDEDNNNLLATGHLLGGQNQDSWYGGEARGVRKVRIECNYVINK